MTSYQISSTENITCSRQQTLDELWRKAETLGKVSIENDWGDGYVANIRFERRAGTIIWAIGKNSNVVFALADAINEARKMGA